MSLRFQINAPTVVAETVDGEVIMINLKIGTYYSLVETGAVAWELIEAGATLDEVAAAMQSRYEGEPAAIAAALDELVQSLLDENLVVTREPGEAPPARELDVAPLSGPRLPFAAPRLEPYIDLQKLIQLDPIHEVDDRGWPSTAQQR